MCLQMIKRHSSHTSSADLVSILALPYSDKIVTVELREAVMISPDSTWISDDAQKLL